MAAPVFPTASGRKAARTAWAYSTPDGQKGPPIYLDDARDKAALLDSLLGGLSYDELLMMSKLVETRLIGMLRLNVSSVKLLAPEVEKKADDGA